MEELNTLIGRLKDYQKNVRYYKSEKDFDQIYNKIEYLMNDIEIIINKSKYINTNKN